MKEKQNLTNQGLLFYNIFFRSSAVCAAILTLKPLLSSRLSPIANTVLHAASVHSSIYLAAATYGIVNDWFATGESIQYFARGHQPGSIFLNTYDRFSNTFVWGQIATGALAHLAGLIFSTTSLYLNYRGFAEQQVLAPTVIIASALVAVLTELIMKFPLVNSQKVNSFFVGAYDNVILGSFDNRVETSLGILKEQNKLHLFSQKLNSRIGSMNIKNIQAPFFLDEDQIKWAGQQILMLYKSEGSAVDVIDKFMIDMSNTHDAKDGPSPHEVYKDSYLYKEQTLGIETDEQKSKWLRCSIRNIIGYAVMPTLGALGLLLYRHTRIHAYTFTPNLDTNPIAQIVFPAAILAGLFCGDYHVRNHKRTWEGEELPDKYLEKSPPSPPKIKPPSK